MYLSRIYILFQKPSLDTETQLRLTHILTATCLAASKRQSEREFPLPLTSELNGVSIDEVMDNHKILAYSIFDTLRTLKELIHEGYLNDDNGDFGIITLTDDLFRAIAIKWTHRRANRYTFRGLNSPTDFIWANSQSVAQEIYRHRLDRLERTEQKEVVTA